MSDAARLVATDIRVIFQQGKAPPVTAVAADSLTVPQGLHLGISGPSGSGKTTLLHVLAGLLRPTTGTVCWGAQDLTHLPEGARDRWRRTNIGFVFQDFHLVPELTARENVLLPTWFAGWTAGTPLTSRATALLAEVGVPDPDRRAGLLSRGEQQRVAIARALLARPTILLADEPTASLDGETAGLVADLLTRSARDSGATLILISHDPAMLARMQQVRRMEKGVLLP